MHPVSHGAGPDPVTPAPRASGPLAGGGRILQVSKYYPPIMGGIERVAWELTEGLNRAGVPTDVLCSHQQARTSIERAEAGYRIVRAASWGRLLSTSVAPSMVPALRRFAHRYDAIHLHMPDPMAALAVFTCRPAARLIVHWHSDVVRQRVAMHAYRHLQDWVLRRADAIVATSAAYAASSTALRPFADKVSVVPIGISGSRHRADAALVEAIRQRYPGRRIVFALGRMTHYKGFDVLIRAATSLPADSVVLIGGNGALLPRMRRLIDDFGLGDKVKLLGHVRDDELPSYFHACDVFCMPSTLRAEAYGVAIVEAMHAGRPVVATDIPGSGVPWVNLHRETGLNVPVGNPVALSAALCSMLADPAARRRYGEAARARFEREFRAERMIERTAALYDSIGVARTAGRAEPTRGGRWRAPFEPAVLQPAAAAVLEPETLAMHDADTVAMPVGARPLPEPPRDFLLPHELAPATSVDADTTVATPSVRPQVPATEPG